MRFIVFRIHLVCGEPTSYVVKGGKGEAEGGRKFSELCHASRCVWSGKLVPARSIPLQYFRLAFLFAGTFRGSVGTGFFSSPFTLVFCGVSLVRLCILLVSLLIEVAYLDYVDSGR